MNGAGVPRGVIVTIAPPPRLLEGAGQEGCSACALPKANAELSSGFFRCPVGRHPVNTALSAELPASKTKPIGFQQQSQSKPPAAPAGLRVHRCTVRGPLACLPAILVRLRPLATRYKTRYWWLHSGYTGTETKKACY